MTEARERLEAGESIDKVLQYLRDSGAGPIDSMDVLVRAANLSLTQAQQTLQTSVIWRDALVRLFGEPTGSGRPSPAKLRWNWEQTRLTPAIVDEAERRANAGESLEEILRYLRDNDATPVDSLKSLVYLYNLSLTDARLLLHASDTWGELRHTG